MKKIVIGIVLVIVVGVLAVPKLIGNNAHEAYLKSFDAYPTGTSGVSFEHRSYKQSWFSSDAVTVMKFPLGLPEVKEVSVVLTAHIAHGPVLSTDKGIALGLAYIKANITLAGLPDAAQKLVDQYLPVGTITTASLIDFKQRSHDVMHIGSVSFKDDKTSVVFGGLNLSGVSTLDYAEMKGAFTLPASHITAGGMQMDIADAAGSYDMHMYRDLMMLGKSDLNFPQFKFVSPVGAVTLEDFKIVSNAEEQTEKLNMTASIGVRKITAPVPVTAFQYDFELNQVDVKALELWGEISKDLKVQSADPAAALNNPKLNQFLALLLQKDLVLQQKLSVDGMGGKFNIDWDSRFVGLPDGAQVDMLTDKTQLAKAVEVHVLVNIDEKVLMATPLAGMATPYMQNGMIVKQGEKLVADIKLSAGVLTVNGNPIPLPK